ncbi:15137_t:CDS:2 [Entrophospora sp. SA101]|nr:15137_t:CDS:2 [Entrophospora sp. SA101]
MTTPKYFDPWARREAWRNQFGFRNNVRLSWPGLSWGIGAFIIYLGYETLANHNEGNKRVIMYASRQLKPADYTATELECLGIIWAIKHFHSYLSGSKFKLITDHAALKYLNNMKESKGKLA